MENQLFNFISIGKTLLENQSLWIYYFLPSASPALSPSHNKQYGENEKTIIALNAPATIQSELTGYLKPKFWIIAIVHFGKRKTEILYFWLVINWRLVVWMENYTMKPYVWITIRLYGRLLSVWPKRKHQKMLVKRSEESLLKMQWHVPIRFSLLPAFQTPLCSIQPWPQANQVFPSPTPFSLVNVNHEW